MTAAEELEYVYAALRSYVAELRERASHPTPVMVVGEVLVLETVSDEIEARFLTDDAWKRITVEQEPCAQCGGTPTDRGMPGRRWCSALCEVKWWGDVPLFAEPVSAFGEEHDG